MFIYWSCPCSCESSEIGTSIHLPEEKEVREVPKMYQELLIQGQHLLSSSLKDNDSKNVTGLEPSLVGSYLDQLIKLNYYLFTDASTNYPADPFFQPMILKGWIHKDLVTNGFIQELKKMNYSFYFVSTKDCVYENEYECHNIHQVLHDMLSKYWFGVNDLPELAIPSARKVHRLWKHKIHEARQRGTLALPEKFQKIFWENKKDFRKSVKMLNETDLKEVRNIIENTENHQMYKRYKEWKVELTQEQEILQSPELSYGLHGVKSEKQIIRMITDGDLYRFMIMDHYDPIARTLYENVYLVLLRKK